MAIPWDLVGSLALAVALALVWLRTRRETGAVGPVVDLATTVALGAVLGGRVAALLADLLLSGALPSPAGMLSLAAGLSTPGAVAGALVAGALAARRTVPAERWRLGATAAALGLAAWSLLALVRGDAGGLAAPPPLGWPLPGEPQPRVPVALLEAAAYALSARLLWRRGPGGPHVGARLGVVVLLVHLGGTLLRPLPAGADADLDVLLALAVLAAAALAARRTGAAARRVPAAATRPAPQPPDGQHQAGGPSDGERSGAGRGGLARTGAVAAGAVAVVIALVGVLAAPGRDLPPAASLPPALDDAITADAAPTDPPRWGEAELAAFVAAAGRPVVVNFWASWCPPCHAEAPMLARSAEALGDEVVFVGVLVRDEPDDAHAFARRYGLPFATVLDGGLSGALSAAGLPTTVVLRPDGSVADRVVGGLDARGLAAGIDRARRPAD